MSSASCGFGRKCRSLILAATGVRWQSELRTVLVSGRWEAHSVKSSTLAPALLSIGAACKGKQESSSRITKGSCAQETSLTRSLASVWPNMSVRARPAEFICSLETLLEPGGLALLYLITGIIRRPTNGWTEKCISPGSYIPVIRKTFDDRFGRGAALSARLGGQFPGGDHRSASDPSFPRPLEPPSHARRPLLGVGDLRAHFAAQYLLEVQSGRGWSQQVKERKYAG